MQFLEKYRDHSLIAKVLAYVMFLDAGTSILGMFIKMIRYEYYSFSIWTILFQAVPILAGLIFLLNKHHDKIFKMAFAGALVLTKLISLIRVITMDGNPSVKYVLTCFLQLVLAAAFAVYYLGIIRAIGRKFYFIFMYSILGVAAIFAIFNIGSVSIGTYAICAVLALYGYQEIRTQDSMFVYAGMIGAAYYVLYTALTGLLGMFSVYLPGFFRSVEIILCMAMPLLVYDRFVPGEGMPFALDFSALSGNSAPQQYAPVGYQQSVQQNKFDPMTGQPLAPQQPVQQNNFDPMTGQPLTPQQPVQQNNFDPMTGQPIAPNQPVQLNKGDQNNGQ